MNNWFTVKVKYTKQMDNGTFKRVSELYLLSAITFTDAEARIYEELGTTIRGEFQVIAIQRVEFNDVFLGSNGDIFEFYQIKISYQDTTDEKSKLITQKYLINATSIENATESIIKELSTMMIDYKIESVIKSNIVDVFSFKN
jgi:hypothetical protein